jgi:hypothetical protein
MRSPSRVGCPGRGTKSPQRPGSTDVADLPPMRKLLVPAGG